MDTDHDIAASLPEPPPPRPVRREAAIEAALRRFDGVDAPTDAPAPAPPRRARIGRPQLAGLVTVLLVAMIGLPVWLSGDHRFGAVSHDVQIAPAAPGARTTAPVAGRGAELAAADQASTSATDSAVEMPVPAKMRAAPPPAVMAAPAEAPVVMARQESAGLPASSARVAGRADMAAAPVAAAPPPPPPPEPAPAAMADMAEARNDVVVTGQLRQSAKAIGRGDWNACTVNDPRHDLDACKRLVDPAARGTPGRAAAQIADGLSAAWAGDADAAIAAFGRAIEIAPRRSFAYLNRGLAYARAGDADHALADLDRAVRYAPDEALPYYQRSLVLRARGDWRKARADEDRAIALDSRYGSIIR